MMKSLGKKKVQCQTFVDGKLVKTWDETRVVYERLDGTYWINNLKSKKQVSRDGLDFYAVYKTATINSTDVQDIFERLGIKFSV